MKRTREMILGHLSLVDACLEVCDARIPVSSRNPVLDELLAGKPRVLVLNKEDLAEEGATREWAEVLRGGARPMGGVLALNAMSGAGVRGIFALLERLALEKGKGGGAKAGIPLRLMIVGIPNCGKSSLINRLTGRRAAQVGDRPGVTRGKQWLTLENGMQLLDTPGILWPKFEDPRVGLNLAFCGAIRDEIMDVSELGLELVRVLAAGHGGVLEGRHGVDLGEIAGAGARRLDSGSEPGMTAVGKGAGDDGCVDAGVLIMEKIARRRGFLWGGGRIDYERTARTVLDEFRAGKLGRITLERAGLARDGRTPFAPTEGQGVD